MIAKSAEVSRTPRTRGATDEKPDAVLERIRAHLGEGRYRSQRTYSAQPSVERPQQKGRICMAASSTGAPAGEAGRPCRQGDGRLCRHHVGVDGAAEVHEAAEDASGTLP